MSVSDAGSFCNCVASLYDMLTLFAACGCAFGHVLIKLIKNPRQRSYRGFGY